MPKKYRGKKLHKKRRGKDKVLENEEIPGLNVATTNKSGSRVADDAIPPSQNMIIDVGSQCTSISALTSSVALHSDSTVTDAKSVADDMVKSLQLLGSRELQSEAFQLAMSKIVFKQLFEKYNNQPATTCNGMPTPTDSALRMRKSRRKQDTIDSIISSINSFCNDKDRNSLM